MVCRGPQIILTVSGIPPTKNETSEEEIIRQSVLPFFNAAFSGSEDGFGVQCDYQPKGKMGSSVFSLSSLNLDRPPTPDSNRSIRSAKSSTALSAKEQRRLSLQSVQARSFQKTEGHHEPKPQQKGYKVFQPGTYSYSFELPIDHTCPETIDVPLGSVRWELEAYIERAGAFRANLQGRKEVVMVRAPDQNSMEQVEPIAISRNWEDQLHYDIVISGKSFPLGSKIPIAFKLTPLAKVQCHRIKVMVTENIEYFCCQKKVVRKDPMRKILLLEKHAGRPMSKEWAGSSVRILSGGDVVDEERDAAASQGLPVTADRDGSTNLLGDLSRGEAYWGPTEIEIEAQLPTCAEMRSRRDINRCIYPDTSWKNIQVHHWIKVRSPSDVDPVEVTNPVCRSSCDFPEQITRIPQGRSAVISRSRSILPSTYSPAKPHKQTPLCQHTLATTHCDWDNSINAAVPIPQHEAQTRHQRLPQVASQPCKR